ncbi:permease [Spirochaetia bacterium]|nr:permease [Spirochaetia bacterium]
MFEDFINALKDFKTNRTRTFLSLLGIIIGVASVIMVTTIGESATGDIKRSLGSAGLDLVQVSSGWGRSRTQAIELNESFRTELASSINDIKNIFYTNEFSGRLLSGGLDLNLSIQAVEQDYFSAMGLTLDYGRFFSVTEQVMGTQKIILGSEVVRYLFPEGKAEGKIVRLQMTGYQMGFEVIGVLAESTATISFISPNSTAFVPRAVYTQRVSPGNINAGNILIQANNQNSTTRIQKDVEKLAEEKSGGNAQALSVFSMQSILEQYNQVTRSMNLLLSGIAGISLLVGGIGIMNIMIVTVTERKREIGIRKALGASPAVIRTQFLVESATLTLFGGAIGIVLGIILSAVVVSFFKWILVIEWWNCIAAFVFSAVVGIFFGIHPAIRAAKLDPVEALAGE